MDQVCFPDRKRFVFIVTVLGQYVNMRVVGIVVAHKDVIPVSQLVGTEVSRGLGDGLGVGAFGCGQQQVQCVDGVFSRVECGFPGIDQIVDCVSADDLFAVASFQFEFSFTRNIHAGFSGKSGGLDLADQLEDGLGRSARGMDGGFDAAFLGIGF